MENIKYVFNRNKVTLKKSKFPNEMLTPVKTSIQEIGSTTPMFEDIREPFVDSLDFDYSLYLKLAFSEKDILDGVFDKMFRMTLSKDNTELYHEEFRSVYASVGRGATFNGSFKRRWYTNMPFSFYAKNLGVISSNISGGKEYYCSPIADVDLGVKPLVPFTTGGNDYLQLTISAYKNGARYQEEDYGVSVYLDEAPIGHVSLDIKRLIEDTISTDYEVFSSVVVSWKTGGPFPGSFVTKSAFLGFYNNGYLCDGKTDGDGFMHFPIGYGFEHGSLLQTFENPVTDLNGGDVGEIGDGGELMPRAAQLPLFQPGKLKGNTLIVYNAPAPAYVSEYQGERNSYTFIKDECTCGVYLRWIRPTGGYDYFMFIKGTNNFDYKSSGNVYAQYCKDETVFGTKFPISKSVEHKLKLGTDLLQDWEIDYVKDVIKSPYVWMWDGNEWVRVNVVDGSFSINNKPLRELEIEIVIPEQNNMSL